MAERMKDAQDRLLESMFRQESIADDGFSKRVIAQIRRRIWLRRLALPIAMLVGGAIAVKPATQLVAVGLRALEAVPKGMLALPDVSIPQLPIIAVSGVLLAIGVLSIRMLEE